jgi:hypothetical protein
MIFDDIARVVEVEPLEQEEEPGFLLVFRLRVRELI